MNTLILACASLEKEVYLAMEHQGVSMRMEILSDNNHDVPNKLRNAIQEKLNELSGIERVLLAFGTCGGAMVGLHTSDYELIIPRVDDCLSLLMGSMENRYGVLNGKFGVFLTESWLNSDKSMEKELARIRSVYPGKRSEKIIQLMYQHFSSLNVIDTGAYCIEKILPRTRKLAEQLHLEHRVVPGTVAYLEKLLTGPWTEKEFIRIAPDSTITDADVQIGAAERTEHVE